MTLKYTTADDIHKAVREHPDGLAANAKHAAAVKALHRAHDERVELLESI